MAMAMEEDLEEEKEKALKIIGKITGTTPRNSKKRMRSNNELLISRYDPNIEKEAKEQIHNVSTRVQDHLPSPEPPEDKFYEVAENLKKAFKKKKKKKKHKNHEFNFLAEMEQESDDGSACDGVARLSSNDAGNGSDCIPAVMESSSVPDTMDDEVNPKSSSFLFFFHTTSPELRNRIDSSKRFVGTIS